MPHNSGEHYDGLAKLTIPLGNHTLRLMGVASETNRLLFDPELKYSPDRGPAQGTSGRLGLLHWQSFSSPGVRNNTFVFDLRLGYFQKNAIRAPLQSALDREFGAFTFSGFDFAGRAVAAAMDSVSALEPIPGFRVPGYSLNSPWGVPAFFRTDQTRGELARNRFSEVKVQVDLLIGRGLDTDVRVGGQYVQQSVETFTRLESYRSVADGAPEPVLSAFEPFSAAAYAEIQQRVEELSLTAGIRVDGFNSRGGLESGSLKSQWAVSPRFALSTELRGATVVASMGRFAQAPDFQFLVDAAFDDTTRTGRFRRGNPSLGFETSWQYEFSVRYRPLPSTGVRVGAFVKQLDGLVSSVPIGIDPDSSIFANADFGRVRGVEATIEREFINGIGARATYVIQEATASASDAFDFFRRFQVTPLGDTIVPASVSIPLDFDRRHSFIGVLRGRTSPALGRWLGRIEVAMVGRWGSGLPFTSTNVTGDTILGLPNSERLPSQFKLDIVLRKTLNIGGIGIGFYADIRNLTNRRNIVAVRKDTGSPDPGEPQIETMATTAFRAHPEPIPFESPRYTRSFDADGNGLIENAAELMPLFRRAARDFLQGIFAYAPPRLIKLGTEIFF
ncbi:MAG: TonB-dependent receptor domain-containing protein [Gemmatimonadales bacterium]